MAGQPHRATATRDVAGLSARPDPQLLRRYLEACAINTAGVASQRTLNETAGFAKATGEAYDAMLASLFLVEALPAWWTNRLKRLTKRAKRFFVDPSLALAALRIDLPGLKRDGHLSAVCWKRWSLPSWALPSVTRIPRAHI